MCSLILLESSSYFAKLIGCYQETKQLKHLKTYRYKLKPSREQCLVLWQWLGACRYVYNLCLDYRKTLWQGYHLNLRKSEAQKEVAALVKDIPWLSCLHSQTLQEVTEELMAGL